MHRDAYRWARAAVVALVSLPVVVVADRLTGGPVAAGPIQPATAAATVAACTAAWLAVAVLLPALHPASRHGAGVNPRTDALLLGLGTVVAQLAGNTVLFLLHGGSGTTTGCLPAVGRGAEAGVQLALLRPDPACPPGTAAAGPTLLAAWTAVLVTLVIIVGHALVAALAGITLAAASASVRVLRTLGDVLLARLPELVTGPANGPGRPIRVPSRRVRRTWHWASPANRRGPPALAWV